MSDTETLTSGARTRIRMFTLAVSALVVVVIAIAVFASGVFAVAPAGDPVFTDDDYYRPWENPEPNEAVRDGDEFSGTGQAFIRLTGLDPGEPLRVDYDSDGPVRRIYMTGPNASVPRGLEEASEFTTYGDDVYVVPSQSDIELWVSTTQREPWTVEVSSAGLEQHDGTVSGVGSDAFVYTGTASAARVTTRGEYSVTIDVVTVRGPEEVYYSGEDSTAASIAWPDSGSTVFVVDSFDEESSWSIEFLELAQPESPTPEPSPTSEEGEGDE